MIKIFYYDDDTENLLTEDDAEETTLEEAIDEVFNLPDDDTSYVGFIKDKARYQIKSDEYDAYKIYFFESIKAEYILNRLVDFEGCKDFISTELFSGSLSPTGNENPTQPVSWLPPDWNKN